MIQLFFFDIAVNAVIGAGHYDHGAFLLQQRFCFFREDQIDLLFGGARYADGSGVAAAVTGVDGDDFAAERLAAAYGGGLLRMADRRNGAKGAGADHNGGKERKGTEFADQNKGSHERYSGYFVD